MIISGLNNITSAYGSTFNSSVERQKLPAAMANYADRVTLSGAGKKLSAQETGPTQARTPAQEKLLRAASSDSASAEKIARDMAYTPSTIFYDLRGVGGGEPVTKLSTGRIIDDAFKDKFSGEAARIDAQRLAIYQSEKAKGTDPLLILSKVIDFTNMQSSDYLEASGWGWKGNTPPA